MPTKKVSTTLPTLDKVDENAYETFVQALHVFTIALVSCSCDINRPAYFEQKTDSRSFNHEYEILDVGADYFDALGNFLVTIAGSKESAPVLRVQCAFQVHIHGQEPISRDYAQRFANSELKLILIPYARQFVSTITSQMSVPPVVLPLTKQVGDPKGVARTTGRSASKNKPKKP